MQVIDRLDQSSSEAHELIVVHRLFFCASNFVDLVHFCKYHEGADLI